jgi:hypothetical protein
MTIDEKALEAAEKAYWDAGLDDEANSTHYDRVRHRLRAALAAHEVALWQPIESATTGDNVLTAYPDGTVKKEIADGKLWRIMRHISGPAQSHGRPVAWRPLPAPPKGGG